MEISVNRDKDYSVVHVIGDVDLYSSPELQDVVLDLFQNQKQQKVVLNLRAVPYIDSSDVANLVEALQEAKKRKLKLILAELNDGPRHVLELTRLLDVFEVFLTEQDTLA